jgi:hypothetical protein
VKTDLSPKTHCHLNLPMLENTDFSSQMETDLALRVTVLVEETRNLLFFASLRFKSKSVLRGEGLHKSLELQI